MVSIIIKILYIQAIGGGLHAADYWSPTAASADCGAVLHEGVGLIGVACLITPRLFHRSSHHQNDHHKLCISFIILTAALQSQLCENNRKLKTWGKHDSSICRES